MLQGRNVCSNPDELLLRQFKDSLARSTTSVTSFQDFSEFRQRKADPKCSLNDVNPLNRALGIYPITRRTPHSLRQHADLFVMSNRVWTDSGRFRECPGMESLYVVTHLSSMDPRMHSSVKHFYGQLAATGWLVDVNRWDEKAGLLTGCGVRSQVIDVLEAQIKRRPAMKKVSTAVTKQRRNFSQPKRTIGLDLGDRNSWYCVLDEGGQIRLEQRVRTNAKALREVFGEMPRSRIALETGTHSPWISRLLNDLGHEVIVANARKVRLIGESRKKDDRLDAQTLARLARIDSVLLCPVKHRSAQAQADLTVIRARAALVRARTGLVNSARSLAKSYGERLRGCNVRNMNPEKAESLSPELQVALEPLLHAIESLSERIVEYNDRIGALAEQRYPQVELLKQIKGVGTLIALTFLLTLEDPHRFRKSRDVGCYLGLQPGRRNSGQSEPQMHISKEGDPYLRTLLVQGAQHILGPFGVDCDLRRWGLKLAERGGKSCKKRAIVATARKLAVLLHHLWVSGEVYEPLHNSSRATVAAAA
jgi:transposase